MCSVPSTYSSPVSLNAALFCYPKRVATLALAAVLGGCATYAPKPLDQHAHLLKRIPVTVDARAIALPQLQRHVFDPSNGLDMTEVAMLAAVNNPMLKVQRRQAGVARAQLFAARLLPDPQLSAATDHPTSSGPGLTNAYNFGLNYDIGALITHSAGVDAAKAATRQVDLGVLWQEWQVVQQARVLYVQILTQQHKLDLLKQVQTLYAERYRHSAKALRQGNLTVDVTGTDLTALLDANSRVSQAERDLNRMRHDLNALLGLSPDAVVRLSPLHGEPRLPHAANTTAALSTLAKRRPDLLALQAGYASQEAKVRQAILAQFPSINVGLTRARDTSNIHTVGIGVTLNLPILNGNRGAVAIERATRSALRQQYRARLAETRGSIDKLVAQAQLIERQLDLIRAYLPTLEGMIKAVRSGYEARNVSALTYLNIQNTVVNKKIESLDLTQALWDTRIALDTLLGWPEETHP